MAGDGGGVAVTAWLRDRLAVFAVPLALAVLWEVATRTELLDPRYFIPLTEIVATIWDLAVTGVLQDELGITVRRLLLAFLIAAVGGIALGVASGLWRPVALFFRPLVDTLYPTPKIALLPLLIILVGLGEAAFIATAFATAFFQITLGVAASVRNLDPLLVEAGRNFGARGPRYVGRLILPAIMPGLLNALRLGMATCLITVVVVEFVAARSGLGHLIQLAWQQLQVDRMYAGLVVAGLLGHAINLTFRGLERLLMPWRPAAATVRSSVGT
jgi:ABC-type nitrate/sulfonate/bicarbonate transport system permease component